MFQRSKWSSRKYTKAICLLRSNYGYYPESTEENSNDEEENYYDDYQETVTIGDIIYEKEIETIALPKLGNSRLFTFNIEDRLPISRGSIILRWDLAKLLGQRQPFHFSFGYWIDCQGRTDKLFVFANSIKTAGPVNGVNVIAYGNNNQVLGMGSTNEDGVAEIGIFKKRIYRISDPR